VVVVNAVCEPVLANSAYHRLLDEAGPELTLLDEIGVPLAPSAIPERRAAAGDSADLEVALRDRLGVKRFYRVTVRPVVPHGDQGEVGFVVYADRTDAHLRALEEEFVARIAHELRTPASGLQNYGDLLLNYTADDCLTSDVRRMLKRIQVLSERVNAFVGDLFDVVRVSTGTRNLVREPVDAHQLVADAVEVARALLDAPPISVDMCSEPIVVLGDVHQLGSVVLNLLTNAITHAAGTHQIDVRLSLDSIGARIDVEDYGSGIASDDLTLMFTKHYQGSALRHDRSRSKGLGLGLFIAHEVVVAHGGRIDVTSRSGIGTRFIVHLPAA